MPVRENPVAPASRRLFGRRPASLCVLLICSFYPLFQPSVSAKTKPVSVDPGYLPALAVADRLMQAWQTADPESGLTLLTDHAKRAATTEVVERFFADPGPSAYEITHGKLLKPGRYEFPVVLVMGSSASATSKKPGPRRRFSSIVVVNTGHNDWAVDKLP